MPVLGVALLLAGLAGLPGSPGIGAFSAGVTLLGVSVGMRLAGAVASWRRNRALAAISDFLIHDAVPCFLTDDSGDLQFCNQAAERIYATGGAGTLAGALRGTLANPQAVIGRLRDRAVSTGSAREDVVTRRGNLRLSAQRIGRRALLWRAEAFADRTDALAGGEAVGVPRLTVGRGGAILFMNDPARRLVGGRARALDRLFAVPPVSGTVCDLDTAEGRVPALVVDLPSHAGRREMFLFPPPEGPPPVAAASGDVEFLPVPLLHLAADGRVVRANREARRLLGGGLDAETRLADLMEGLGRPLNDWLADAAAGRGLNRSEFLRLNRKDREVFVQVTLNPVTDGGEAALIAVLNDATELKTLEAQFVQSQKMQAIGQLAGGVAHDFNNLLTAISGHCDLLLLRHDQGDPDYADLVQIGQNANRAAALVGQLLAFSRKQTLRPQVLDLRETLSDLTHLLNRLVGAKVSLTLSHDPVLPPVRADKRQLEQVMMNLVVNARDAMPEGGEIRIETEGLTLQAPLERGRATVPAGAYVTVKVTDEGVGIPPEDIEKVFEPFFTTKRVGEGTGLGLSTVYGIVKQTGGFIFVDSAPGSGSCFTLFLPVHSGAERPVEPAISRPARTPALRRDAVILLVEDEAPVRAFASRALRLRGYTVIEAGSAEEALETLKDADLSVDVFVTDVVMPGRDGPSWVREALRDRPDTRVVFVSGYAEESFEGDRARLPNAVFLPKPFSLKDLAETVQRQLH
ncbi:MAG: ATP-binding protein [Paracoccaceae bacterium]